MIPAAPPARRQCRPASPLLLTRPVRPGTGTAAAPAAGLAHAAAERAVAAGLTGAVVQGSGAAVVGRMAGGVREGSWLRDVKPAAGGAARI